MGYCTVEELRAEGVTEEQADDTRLQGLIDRASAMIDAWTGQWFEPRTKTFVLDGHGQEDLPLPLQPVAIDSVTADGLPVSGYTVCGDPEDPYLHLAGGWPEGRGNIVVRGTFGRVDEAGKAPLLIRLACMRLVIRELPKLADTEAQEDRLRSRIAQESTAGHSYTLRAENRPSSLSGDPEIDSILALFRAPLGGGVV